jgi:hypothetical protein
MLRTIDATALCRRGCVNLLLLRQQLALKLPWKTLCSARTTTLHVLLKLEQLLKQNVECALHAKHEDDDPS